MTRLNRIGALLICAACGPFASCSKQLPVVSTNPIPNGGVVKGMTALTGWAAQQSGIQSVILYVDAKRAAEATLRQDRPDVTATYPQFHGSAIAGWRANLDASSLRVGLHYLTVMARAKDGTYTQQTVDLIVSR